MRHGDGSEDRGRELEKLVRLGIGSLPDVTLLRFYLVAMLLVGPHDANDFLVEAVGRLMKPERDPSNPSDDLGKRLIKIMQTIPIKDFVNPPGAEDMEEIEQLVKRDDDPLLLKLFRALGAGLSEAEFAEINPEGTSSENPSILQKLRKILWKYLDKRGPRVP